jgi:cellobiose phosphorylase
LKYGHFSKDNLEFVITSPVTPHPWINYLTNEEYCAIISQSGGGYSFYKDCRSDRILRWLPGNWHFDRPGRYIYVKENLKEKSNIWSAAYQPIRKKPDFYRCRHGLGYTVIETRYNDIHIETTFFVPQKDTCEVWKVKVTNLSSRVRDLELFPYIEWLLGDYHLELRYRNIMNLYNRIWYDKNLSAILAKKTASWSLLNIQPFGHLAFFASSLKVKAHITRKESFLGKNNTEENPSGLAKKNFKNVSLCSGEDGIGLFLHRMRLAAKVSKEFTIILGQTETRQKVRQLLAKYRDIKSTEEELARVVALWKSRIVDNIKIKTPDRDFNALMNIWVKYQLYICNFWSRSPSYYHEGSGGRGYRDSCQDAEAIGSINSGLSRKKIKAVASLIRRDGTTAPGWSDTKGPHKYLPNKDHPVWLTSTVYSYIKETGDKKILLEKFPYLKDRWIDGATRVDPSWNRGPVRIGEGTLFEHLKKNLDFTFRDTGSKGLPLIGHADWNDAIDSAGIKGKGESVWLAMILVRSLKILAEMANLIRKPQVAAELKMKAKEMTRRINKWAWDGTWYVRGFTDDGTVYGSSKNKGGKIYLNTQSWAVLSGVADQERSKKLHASVDRYLAGRHGTALFYPAYSRFDRRLGRISMFSEGTKENAAVFCHAAAWQVVADCLLGKGNKAYEGLRKIMPNCQGDYDIYKTEPYVFAEYLIGPQHPYLYGEGSFTWVTGTAGWSFLAATQYILGLSPEYDGLRVSPCIPSHWKRYKVIRPFRGSSYEITVENPKGVEFGVKEVYIEGRRQEGNLIPAGEKGKRYRIKVIMGK